MPLWWPVGVDNRTLWHVGPAPAPKPEQQATASGTSLPVSAPEPESPAPRQRAHAMGDVIAELELGDRFADGEVVEGTRYRVTRFIGDGGMGQVYEAEHLDLDRPVAMKVLLPALSRAPEALAMFRREARAASRLGADQIVQVYDFAELPDGRLMFAMELLDGPTLAALLNDGPMSVPRVTAILRQVCKGLTAAHDAGVVHRDIKPENVVLLQGRGGRPDTVKILDFGISTILDDQSSESTVAAGTPYYLAPEFIAGKPFDGRMDLYALGCMAHELLSGAPPFTAAEGEGVTEILSKHLHDAPPRLSKKESNVVVPIALQRVVLRCLAKEPAERYADAGALEAALCEAQIDAKLTTSWDDLPLPQDIDADLRDRLLRNMPDPSAPPVRRGGTLMLGALAVAIGAGATYYLTRPDASKDASETTAAAATEAPVSVVDGLVAEARTAAARSYFVVPAADDAAATTAYRKVRELEALATDEKRAAQEQALVLRDEFAATLVRLGDQYWSREGGKTFALDYYKQALVFVRDQPTALERAGLTPAEMADYEAKAASGDFTEQELLDAEPLVALAEPDDAKRRSKITALRRRHKGRRTGKAGRAEDAASERLLAMAEGPAAAPDKPAAPAAEAGAGAGATALAETARKALKAGDLTKAQLFLDRALTFDVNNRAALSTSFALQVRKNDHRAAVAVAQRLVAAHPKWAEGHRKLGEAHQALGSLVAARAAYAKAAGLGSSKGAKQLAKLVAKIGPEPEATPKATPKATASTADAPDAEDDPVEPSTATPEPESGKTEAQHAAAGETPSESD